MAVAREHHRDGSVHMHCLGQWPCALRTRDERLFDYAGHHPNVQGCRNLRNVLTYITKEDDDAVNDFPPEDNGNYYKELMCAANEREFWEIAKREPRTYILYHEKLEHICRKHFGTSRIEWKPKFTEWGDIPNRLLEWFGNLFGPTVNEGRYVFYSFPTLTLS